MSKENIYLPNPGCEYLGTHYDKDNDVWIIKYRQKPGYWPQVLKDTRIPMPSDDPGKVRRVKIKDGDHCLDTDPVQKAVDSIKKIRKQVDDMVNGTKRRLKGLEGITE